MCMECVAFSSMLDGVTAVRIDDSRAVNVRLVRTHIRMFKPQRHLGMMSSIGPLL